MIGKVVLSQAIIHMSAVTREESTVSFFLLFKHLVVEYLLYVGVLVKV